MSNLDQAIEIACKAHSGQLDKAGQPYILHPLRLMMKFQAEDERVVAVLHDVVEDSQYTLHYLEESGFSASVLEAIDCLTKRNEEKYTEFIERVLQNDLAVKIKTEDIKDNLDVTRLNKISDEDYRRIKKYHAALEVLRTYSDPNSH